MEIFNSMTRRKEEFVPIEPGKVRMYACGPTVYNLIHVGNARPIILFDVLRRYLEYRGYEVTFVQNFTDVDDKIIKRANEEGISSREVAEKYIAEYFKDAKALGVRPATIHPRATETMDEIIDLVRTLVDKGLRLRCPERRRLFPHAEVPRLWQALPPAHRGSPVGRAHRRERREENPLDFALWKAAKPGEPSWDLPWGKGRPGWHIECSAMNRNISARRSTSTAAARTCSSPITRTRLPSPRRPTASHSSTTGCTTAF